MGNSIYSRAVRDEPSVGICDGKRPTPTLEEARLELSQATGRILRIFLSNRYGPFIGDISEVAIEKSLLSLELKLERYRGDFTLLMQELFDRVMQSDSKRII